MSRSKYKPNFIHPSIKEYSLTEFIFKNRSTIFTNARVGYKAFIYNGIRWYNIIVSSERVGHLAGEFSPTRKRPIPKKKQLIKKTK